MTLMSRNIRINLLHVLGDDVCESFVRGLFREGKFSGPPFREFAGCFHGSRGFGWAVNHERNEVILDPVNDHRITSLEAK